jgi:dCTP deaminase
MPIDGGWEGYYTLQIANLSKFFIKIHAFQGIAQIVFFEGNNPDKNYLEKGGNYQNSKDIVTGINS